MLVKLGRRRPTNNPTRANLHEFGPNLGTRRNFQTTSEQWFRNLCAGAELSGIAGGKFGECVASNVSAIFW